MHINRFILVGLLTFTALQCKVVQKMSIDGIKGNGISAVEMRDLSSFKEIRVELGYDKISVYCGKDQSLEIRGDENLLSYIQTRVYRGVLTLSSDSSLETTVDSEIIIHVKKLKKFTFDGVGETVLHDVSGKVFHCELNGVGSSVIFGDVDALHLMVNGVGSIDAKALIAKEVTASLNGVGSAEIYAKQSLTANINGIGGLTYFGNPEELVIQDNGLGGVSKGD